MADKLKEIPGKILEWWNKFTNKQKTIIVAITAAVIFTFVIIVYVFSRPQYTTLGTYESSTDAAKVISILDSAGITHKESEDIKTIQVVTSQLSQAHYALAVEGFVAEDLKYSSYVTSSMTTTSRDWEKQYEDYVRAKLKAAILVNPAVKDAQVNVTLAPQTSTLYATQNKDESGAYIQLVLNNSLTSAQGTALARAAATIIGSSSTKNVTILDQDYNVIFAGGDEYTSAGIAGSIQELNSQAESMVASKTKRIVLGTKQFDNVDVSSYLSVDYAEYQRVLKEYQPLEGTDRGVLQHEDNFSYEASGGTGGIPGTDSNGGDLTTYVNPDYNESESSQEEYTRDYLVSVLETSSSTSAGVVDYDASSISVSLIKYHDYYYETVRRQGLLAGISWDEFKDNNREPVKLEVDEDFYALISNATGIRSDNITIIAYESPVFHDKEGLNVSITDILSIVMIILIVALLAFVVLRSMGGRKGTQEEEELSVENMLQSQPESTMEDIDVEAKSETRKLIEKFVDENPEAAANLLRNWLNEDWN